MNSQNGLETYQFKMYAVANGRSIGIFDSWEECKRSVAGYKFAKYKKFQSIDDARRFVYEAQNREEKEKIKLHFPNVSEKEEKEKTVHYVYTDGACSNNGNADKACSGIGVFFGLNDPRNVSLKLGDVKKHTNNVAELRAIMEAYKIVKDDLRNGKKFVIVSDSTYAIGCATTYGEKCSRNNWSNNIPNKEEVQAIYNLFKDENNVTFMYIPAHTSNTDAHSIGNYYADKLATEALTNC